MEMDDIGAGGFGARRGYGTLAGVVGWLSVSLLLACTGLRDDNVKDDLDTRSDAGEMSDASVDEIPDARTPPEASTSDGGAVADASDQPTDRCEPGVFDQSRFDQACFQ
jgi:hypothetical protein